MADYLFDIAGDGGKLGRGGMLTKIRAARLAAMGGCPTVIANGDVENVISRVVAGEPLGTLLTTNDADKLIAKKQWHAAHLRMMGRLILDDGAVTALVKNHKSLLMVGVTEVQGDFEEGDVVECVDKDGIKIAVGQVSICAQKAKKLLLDKSPAGSPVILHRDNMAVV